MLSVVLSSDRHLGVACHEMCALKWGFEKAAGSYLALALRCQQCIASRWAQLEVESSSKAQWHTNVASSSNLTVVKCWSDVTRLATVPSHVILGFRLVILGFRLVILGTVRRVNGASILQRFSILWRWQPDWAASSALLLLKLAWSKPARLCTNLSFRRPAQNSLFTAGFQQLSTQDWLCPFFCSSCFLAFSQCFIVQGVQPAVTHQPSWLASTSVPLQAPDSLLYQ